MITFLKLVCLLFIKPLLWIAFVAIIVQGCKTHQGLNLQKVQNLVWKVTISIQKLTSKKLWNYLIWWERVNLISDQVFLEKVRQLKRGWSNLRQCQGMISLLMIFNNFFLITSRWSVPKKKSRYNWDLTKCFKASDWFSH